MSDAPAPPAESDAGPERADGNLVGRAVTGLERLGVDFATQQSPRLERLGMRIFRRREERLGAPPIDAAVHIIDAQERAAMMRICRRALVLAAICGAASGLASAVASWLTLPEIGATTTFWEDVRTFLIVNAATIAATLVEVFFLYRIALASTHELARTAGIRLVPAPGDPDAQERRGVAVAMIRAAVELPNPPQGQFPIDPYREISKWRVILATIIYKLKITLTNFVLRLIMRRIAGRVAIRAWLVFIDVPVTAAWDAAVMWRVMREARIRGMGPSASEAFLRELRDERAHVWREEVRDTMARAVAVGIVRSRDVHPNLEALLRSVWRQTDMEPIEGLDDAERLLSTLDTLEEAERDDVLAVLAVAAFIDGHLARAERRFYREAMERVGRVPDVAGLKALRKRFVAGERFTLADVRAVVGAERAWA